MQFNKKQIDVRGGACESYVRHPSPPPKFENPFFVQDNVKKALFSRKAQQKQTEEPSEQESEDQQHLNTAEKQKLKREMMLMGYDESSYDQEQDNYGNNNNGQYMVDDDDEGAQDGANGMSDEQIFKEQKKLFAA